MSVRFGLLGTGRWADVAHATGLAGHPEVDFVGIWGRDSAKASALAERHGTAGEPDLDTLLARVDAVAIALPPDVQAELAVKAAAAGCHLLLEKPLATSVEDAERIVAATQDAGVASIMFFTARFAEPAASRFRELLDLEWHSGSVGLLLPSAPTPPAWELRNAGLWGSGPHALAALLPTLGAAAEVTAEPGYGDTVHMTIKHMQGGVSWATFSNTLPKSVEMQLSFELQGPSGTVRPPWFDSIAGARDVFVDAHRQATSALIEAMQTGVPHPCDVRFAAEVVRVLAAAERFMERPAANRGERP